MANSLSWGRSSGVFAFESAARVAMQWVAIAGRRDGRRRARIRGFGIQFRGAATLKRATSRQGRVLEMKIWSSGVNLQ
jgi:hypothetical protein